jgi:hypothetical protein
MGLSNWMLDAGGSLTVCVGDCEGDGLGLRSLLGAHLELPVHTDQLWH